MSQDINNLIKKMTTEQKASLCSGKDFWNLVGIEELGIPSIMVTDGPHGLRKQAGEADHVGLSESVPSTCFPTASALASSWDEELLYNIGTALGEECRQEKVAVILGPGVNIKRSPLCGRNFEYFSEDPYLGGKLAAAHIKGVQSQGIGTSLKHYAANNQERRRMIIDTLVDERTLREIYLAGFEEAVKSGRPDTVMCAYNRLNGEYCSENKWLLTDILKDEWGHEGFVVTDWGAANDRVKGLAAGLELEMPSSGGLGDALILEAVNNGKLDESVLDEAVRRILKVVFKTSETLKSDYSYDVDAHHNLARRAAAESAVLLKNNGILPLSKGKKIAVIGDFAVNPRYQGSGSSIINPVRLDKALEAINKIAGTENVVFASGYKSDSDEPDDSLITEAVEAAENADIAVVFAGLPDSYESEGFDREHLHMPASHNELISAIASVNSSTVVVLSNGSPVSMPWFEEVSAVLETYLGGQAWGSAAAEVLFGHVNPSGKLAETFPLKLEDLPASANFPGGTSSVAYTESVYVGYRYFDTAGAEVLFPFGYGLSYTKFEYSGLSVSEADDEGNVRLSFEVKNTGDCAGSEIAQIYVRDIEASVFRPDKELKGFKKIRLESGESRTVELCLDRRAFAFWDTGMSAWTVETGKFAICVGASSADIRLVADLTISSADQLSEWARELATSVPGYFSAQMRSLTGLGPDSDYEKLLGRKIRSLDRDPEAVFDRTSTLEEVSSTFFGNKIYKGAMNGVKKQFGTGEDEKTLVLMEMMIKEMPIRNLMMMSGGNVSSNKIDGLVHLINGKPLKGIFKILSKK